MPTTDLQINSKIRAILARHWVDAERLQFRTTAGTVRFHGVIARQGFFTFSDVDTSLVEILINEIQRISGVQKVYFTGVEFEKHTSRIDAPEDREIDWHGGARKRKPETPEAARSKAVVDKRRSWAQESRSAPIR